MVPATGNSLVRKLVNVGGWRRAASLTSAVVERHQSTSTMDLVSLDENGKRKGSIFSTLQLSTSERDYSGMVHRQPCEDDERHWKILLDAVSQPMYHEPSPTPYITLAEELDLVQAAERQHFYDKIVLLLSHGEHYSKVIEDFENLEIDEGEFKSDTLTGKGVGQALTLARRTATFCNKETGLVPHMFVIEPSIKAAQTAFLSFPYETPYCSLSGTQWICHPYVTGINTNPESLCGSKLETLGVDCSMIDSYNPYTPSTASELLENARGLFSWLQEREEKVVVVSGDTQFLQALGYTLNYNGAESLFLDGEMRAIGVCYSSFD